MKELIWNESWECRVARDAWYAMLASGSKLDSKSLARVAFTHAEAFAEEAKQRGYLEFRETQPKE